jgi:SNF2 family DNA or RNA helicase
MKRNFSFVAKNYAYVEKGEIHIVCRFSNGFVEDCRQINGRRWNNSTKTNSFPLSSLPMVKALADRYNIILPTELETHYKNYYEISSFSEIGQDYQVIADLEIGEVIVRFEYNPQMIEAIRMFIPSIKWDGSLKLWRTSIDNVVEVLAFAVQYKLSISPELDNQARKISKDAEKMRNASEAQDAEIDIPGIAIPLLPYQRAGVAYMQKVRKGIIGDQPGLGKTAQAIATVALENAFPVVVVCPNTLKLNWQREVQKFFPNLRVSILTGTKSKTIEDTDVIVVNYDISYERLDDIFEHGFKSLIVDESHAIKNGKKSHRCAKCKTSVRANARSCAACGNTFSAPEETWSIKRTAAVMRLAKSLGPKDFVLLLTGTPITNRPDELIPQLEAVGNLDKFGGAWRFKNRYAPKRNMALNTMELNKRLRELCFVRRLKSDVYTELPELRNALQYLSIAPEGVKKYKEVEADVVEYFARRAEELANEEGSDGTDAYWQKRIRLERSESLVRITALRDVVSKIKYDTATQWIDNFLESSDGEKVIVFAEHIDFVEHLYDRYKDVAVKIRGGVSIKDRQEAVDKFQNDPKCRVFVANMTAASEGLTLTAASDVVFCELGWTPAIHEQCASRCYGRVNDMHGATAWYLLAPNTIDETIYDLLQSKKRVISAVTDGIDVDGGGSVMDGLIKDLVDKGRQ